MHSHNVYIFNGYINAISELGDMILGTI